MALLTAGRLAALEAIVNRALRLDPLAQQRLESLAGKSIRLECTDPAVDVIIAVANGTIHLSVFDAEQPLETTSHLCGDLTAFTRLLTAEDKAAEMINADLRLHGDSGLLIELQEILSNVEIDWEFHLARLVGDLPAHMLGKIGRDGWQWMKNTQPVFWRHLQEYVLEEARLSPNQAELDNFVDQVQALDERVERLQARLQRLLAKVDHPS